MASNLLHIKDSYYFEVPKFLWPSGRENIDDFPEFWVRLDPEYQAWEADLLAHKLDLELEGSPDAHDLVHQWEHWQHSDHANHGRPFDVFLEMQKDELEASYETWQAKDPSRADDSFVQYLNATNPEFKWFVAPYTETPAFQRFWARAKAEVTAADFKQSHAWGEEKLAGYNAALHGKILIPQPFGELRNMYQAESGLCISKFMIIEFVLAAGMVLVFSWLAKRMQASERPRGKLWNLLEVFLLFIRDEIARPAIGGGHDHDDDHDHDHDDADEHSQQSAEHRDHSHGGHENEADRFVPLLWTMFFFILGCNLFGMLPWAGAPTGSFAVTTSLAFITFATVVASGMKEFGPLGFFANQVPSMDLPLPIAIFVKPMLLVIELAGLAIKHSVLAIRLLANMVAGHLVLLGVMGVAFGAHAATQFQGDAAGYWGLAATIAVIGSTLFSMLELFVAFLQAYIFTFLSALFIGAAVHEH